MEDKNWNIDRVILNPDVAVRLLNEMGVRFNGRDSKIPHANIMNMVSAYGNNPTQKGHDEIYQHYLSECEKAANNAVAALSAQVQDVAIPEGCKLVPDKADDAWAERYCELTNKHPDGMQSTSSNDGWVSTTFREMSKREIAAMLAAAPAAKQGEARCPECDGYNCDNGCAYPDQKPPATTDMPIGWSRQPERYTNYPWYVEVERDGKWHLRHHGRMGIYRNISTHDSAIDAMKAVPETGN